MTFNAHKDIKGIEMTPFNGEFFWRKDTGPVRKNFDIPNEPQNKLDKNVRTGRA